MRAISCCLLFLFTTSVVMADELESPVQLKIGDRPIDTERVGHSAPFYGDFDGDGAKDLLVGEFHEGRMRIYRNVGSNSQPRFAEHTFFQAGGKLASVPVG
jgi:hypothetical protein